MHLGFVSAIVPELSVEEVFSLASELSYDCVELMCWPKGKATRRYAGVTHVDVQSLGRKEAQTLQTLSSESGVAISALGYYPNPLSPDPEEAKVSISQIRHLIDAAVLLKLDTVNTFIGRDWHRSVEDNWPQVMEVWKPLVTYAEERQIRIGIENCPMYFTNDEWPSGKNIAYSPAIWRRLFNDLDSSAIGLNYDPSHMIWQQMDAFEPIRTFADRLFHIHAKDVRLDQNRLNEVGILSVPNSFHTPKLPGLGDVDWGKFFSFLTDAGYNGAVCVEVEDRAYEGSLESRIAALRQSVTYLRQFVPAQESL
ncbi:MAG: sugar phosphate isomerase/epimerase [Rhodothermaceae bacterium]|nr:sugar phosphate isomerase/epimerase [Rhodothermaceae bacterium]MXZ57574.1 sugar phosphate isomerase/epimerase [Rhodothermaceae bacterium]MYB91233.1 sugar phosphate isomerase/epimerase [Rhodothermaceae bacterium]MYD68135.1 sugar phosphate isomerase/epimerase [Rhodothermaceae bacterium]MYG45329.1 sugar phosphate isomerase/epimerase [Rhodothermaceae bacterium]